jgi:hypothetical protein
MSEKDLMGQEEELDIDALFAKMMAEKAASGEEVIQAEEEPLPEEAPVVEETEKKRIFLLEIVSELSVLYQWLLHVLFLRWCAAIC